MKILLRQISTGLFLQDSDRWTDDPDRALDFRFLDFALKFVHTQALKQVEVAFVFDGVVTSVSLAQAAARIAA